jgi:prepilin-type N-terminal cleavage/methylation domain-containing protein
MGRGFTLIELLIVVAVIAALIAILVPTLAHVHRNADKAVAAAELGAIQTGLQNYFVEFNMYPPSNSSGGYGGIPVNRGSVMLAQGLLGFLDFNADGAGPSNGDSAFGFRTRQSTMGGQVYGPYVPPDPKIIKGSGSTRFFIDPWENEILYYRSTRAAGSMPTTGLLAVSLIFPTNAGINNFYFNSGDCLGVAGATPPIVPSPFFTLISGGNSNTVAGPVTGSASFLLISAGPDGKYFTADDMVVGK